MQYRKSSPQETLMLLCDFQLSGMSLLEQQLTPDNIPVIVDKCLNQIYGRGKNQTFFLIIIIQKPI